MPKAKRYCISIIEGQIEYDSTLCLWNNWDNTQHTTKDFLPFISVVKHTAVLISTNARSLFAYKKFADHQRTPITIKQRAASNKSALLTNLHEYLQCNWILNNLQRLQLHLVKMEKYAIMPDAFTNWNEPPLTSDPSPNQTQYKKIRMSVPYVTHTATHNTQQRPADYQKPPNELQN